jgi:hypothetical protein
MSLRLVAGIALSRVAGDAPLALALASGTHSNPEFKESKTYKMQGQTIDDIVPTLSGIPDLAMKSPIRLSVPIALKGIIKQSVEKSASSSIGSDVRCTDHCVAIIHLNDGSATLTDGKERNILFVDITPGQTAAKLAHTEKDDNDWVMFQDELTVLERTADSQPSAEEVVEALVKPTVNASQTLHKIYLYNADDSTSDDISSTLQSLFPQTPIVWVTLADISRGAAKSNLGNKADHMSLLISISASMPISIVASNGGQVITVPRNYSIPTRQTSTFTTSKDNQTSATLQVVVGRTLKDKVVLQGIPPKPKGVPRIRVTFDIDMEDNAVVSVEEITSGVKQEVKIPTIFGANVQESQVYVDNAIPDDGRKASQDENEVVGELPE